MKRALLVQGAIAGCATQFGRVFFFWLSIINDDCTAAAFRITRYLERNYEVQRLQREDVQKARKRHFLTWRTRVTDSCRCMPMLEELTSPRFNSYVSVLLIPMKLPSL